MDDFTRRVVRSLADPLMDDFESFLRANTRDGDVEGVEELEKLLGEELRYRAALVESEYVRPPGGWDRFGRG